MAVDKFHKPIGVIQYNYDTIRDTLLRNIGNADHTYDEFGTIIGGVEDPYRVDSREAWFFQDEYKVIYPDYLSYMKGIYSSKLNSDTLEEKSFSLKLGNVAGVNLVNFYYDDNIGVVERYDIVGSFNGMVNTNPNYQWIDSKLGETNNYYLSHTLMKAAMLNDIDTKSTRNITASLPSHFGLSPASVEDITTRYLFDTNGRINTFVTFGVDSPIDMNNWGNYGWISNSAYRQYYDSLSQLSQTFYMKSMQGIDLMSDTEVDTDIDNYANLPKVFYSPKQAYVSRFYLQRMIGNNGVKLTDDNGWYLQFDKLGNETFENGYLFAYAEENDNVNPTFLEKQINNGAYIHSYNITPDANVTDLVAFTNAQFKINSAYRTLHARFHTDFHYKEDGNGWYNASEFETAISRKYGLSMGRNLLREDHATTSKNEEYNGYENPYCRVWTYHYQYHRLMDTIRPFFRSSDSDSANLISQTTLNDEYNWKTFRSDNRKRNEDGSYDEWIPDGGTRLEKYGVTNKWNGLVNITPLTEEENGKLVTKVSPKDCMFSIENLAWKGMFVKDDPENGLSEGEIGPNGGRIMWFPPYNLNFNENVNVNWSSTSFIGRGENIYSYVNTERSGVLSFTILVDHPSIVNYWERKNEANSSITEGTTMNDVDDIDSKEQEILRFFAGCSILTAKEPPMVEKYIPPATKEPTQRPNMEKQEVRTYDKELVFYVFYPNNYSGVDDAPSSAVSAMEYLLNGFGTQKYKNANGSVEDFNTTVDELATYNGTTIGGYEMRRDLGCSLVKSNTASGNTNAVIGEIEYGSLGNPITAVTNYVSRTKKHWYYRVDKRVENEILRTENYVDSDSFGLNSEEGYTDLLNIFTDQTEDNLYSFTDVFVALEGTDIAIESTLYDMDKVNELKSIFEKYKIKSVYGSGFASSHGYTSSNNVLNKNRAQSVINWMKQYAPFNSNSIDYTVDVTDIGNVGKINSVSEFQPKVYRSAKIVVTYEVEETVTLQDSASESVVETNQTTRNGSKYTQLRFLFNDGKNPLQSDTYQPFFNANNSLYRKTNLELKLIDLRQQQEYISGLKSDIDQIYFQSMINKLPSETENGTYTTVRDGASVRYTDEEKFFTMLKANDPMLHHLIVDKIKYFDPAFHSITPEGFNARLTFLHQCTRQGATIGGSDNSNVNTATNLAFGRPPVCVLRIGDQYNTKIIIDSMTIDFGDMTWDFNPEGIGVQQMLANVTLSFKFIGGSDLAGAISRLQNALSFNYYANTGVYDNRADMIEPQDDGSYRMKCFK